MMRAFLVITIFISMQLNAFSLKEKLIKGNVGDYVVTEQQGTYTVLILRSLHPTHLILEEIDIPTINHNPKDMSWKEWVSKQAPGNTAWVTYLIDTETNKLLECYSHTRHSWIYASDPNNFMTRLLTLSLEKTPDHKRKRIGPPPSAEESDRRSLWIPAITWEGKKMDKSPITAWSTQWPKDGSILSGCQVELYFNNFSFPYWIEIKSPHYKASIQTIDSGTEMHSPQPLVFQQTPFFIGSHQLKKELLELHVHCPVYFPSIHLFAVDLSAGEHPLIEIADATHSSSSELIVNIPETMLNTKLQKGHLYKWVLIPVENPHLVIYSENIFEW